MSKENLKKLIEYHNQKYWIENNPEISDEEFDKLTQDYINLGGSLSDFSFDNIQVSNIKYEHKTPMLSLDKAYSIEEVLEWANGVVRDENEEILIEPKFDGWACKLVNINNKILVTTRGDGKIGEDISSKLPLINIESTIPNNSYILGEIVLLKSKFNKYKHLLLRNNGQEYKTTRSALAGILSSKELKQYNIPEKILDFMEYDKYSLKVKISELRNINSELKSLIDSIKSQDYPVDGIVFKLADINYSNSLGNTAHHPRGAIALKYGNPRGISKLINIEWFVGKNQTINPVGIIEPVIIGGHQINRVNLHNAYNILTKDIKINDMVVIERCGEIIPDLVEVIPSENRQNIIINSCPACGAKLEYIEPFLYCTNPNCDGTLLKRLTDSCVRIGLKNIGKETVNKLIDIGIENIYDILTINKNTLYQLPGFADTSVNNLYNEIQRVVKKEIPDWVILSVLNINGFGDELSKVILSNFTFTDLFNCNVDDLLTIPGMAEIRAFTLMEGLEENRELINKLFNILKITETKNSNIINLPTICFTGKMPQPRSYYEDLARTKNYEPVNSVTKDLNLLVTSELDRQSSKVTKAKKLGIKIITLNEFLK